MEKKFLLAFVIQKSPCWLAKSCDITSVIAVSNLLLETRWNWSKTALACSQDGTPMLVWKNNSNYMEKYF